MMGWLTRLWLPADGIPPPPMLGRRSPHWERFRDAWMLEYPACCVCGTRLGCECHHVLPFHLYASLELSRHNLMTLCRVHHFWLGHLGDWRAWNPNARVDAGWWRDKIALRRYHA